jgi:serine/threonine-protein kinase RsbW
MLDARASVPGEAGQLQVLNEFLGEFWSRAALSEALRFPFELALEEVFMNVVMHGTPSGTTFTVDVRLACAGGLVTLVVEDPGPEFDPLSREGPDVGAAIEDRPIGGLGIHLVRELMDQVAYRRADGRNQLTMTKAIA